MLEVAARVAVGLAVWLLVAFPLAVVVGRRLRTRQPPEPPTHVRPSWRRAMTDPTPGVPDHAAPEHAAPEHAVSDSTNLDVSGLPGLSAVPRPLLDAAQTEARALLNGDAAAAATLVGVLGYFGLSAATGSFVVALLGLVPGAVAYGTTVYAQAQAAYRVWRDAEPAVTPVAAPRSADGVPLTPAT